MGARRRQGYRVKFASGIAEDAMNGVTINAYWTGTQTPVNITACIFTEFGSVKLDYSVEEGCQEWKVRIIQQSSDLAELLVLHIG